MKIKWLVTALALIVVSVVLDILLLRQQGEPEWTFFPGFYALFGLVGAMLIIVISRWLGRLWLERNEEYYYHNGDDD